MKTKYDLSSKHFVVSRVKVCLLLVVTFFSVGSCNKDDFDYKNPESIREDVLIFVDMVARKQALELDLIKFSSDNFTRRPFEGTISPTEARDFFEQIAAINESTDDYEKAIRQLEKSGVLNEITTRGLLSSVRKFLEWASGSSKRNRDRLLKVASNLSDSERTNLYNKLRSDWKNKATSEKDFWKKVEKGDYDNQAGQMYSDFTIDSEEFALTAIDKNLTIQSIVVAEGTSGVNAGADLMMDVVSSTLPTGAAAGFTTVKIVNNVGELVSKDGTWLDKAKMGVSIAGDIAGLSSDDPSIGFVVEAVENLDIPNIEKAAGKIVDMSNTYKTSDRGTVKGSSTYGMVKVGDNDTGSKADIVIAQSEKPTNGTAPSIMVVVGGALDKGKEFINTILTAGNWLVSAIDQQGQLETQKVTVTPGQETIIYVITDGESSNDGNGNGSDKDNGKSNDWEKYAKTYPIMNEVPKFAYPIAKAQKVDFNQYGSVGKGVELTYKKGVMTQSNLDTYLNQFRSAGFVVERDTDYEVQGITRYYYCYVQYSANKFDRLGVTIYYFQNSESIINITEVTTQ